MANDPDFLPSMDYFKYEKNVIRDFYKHINDNLCNGINVIADATHISWKSLRKTVENCGKNADKIILIYFNRGLDIALPQMLRAVESSVCPRMLLSACGLDVICLLVQRPQVL